MSDPLLFIGQKDGATLYRVDTDDSDAGTPFVVVAKPNAIAPAGAGGECVFRVLFLTVTHDMACTLRVTPVLDGVAFDSEAVEVELPERSRPVTEEPIKIGLSVPLLDANDVEVARFAMRGTWFTAKVETVGALGDGELTFESLEVEYRVVRESKEPAR